MTHFLTIKSLAKFVVEITALRDKCLLLRHRLINCSKVVNLRLLFILSPVVEIMLRQKIT